MAFEPTKEQELAINEGGSIIVSAAAGSGKTAVLVERVARILTDKKHPVPANKLLIVTFTNAAAAELRYRIEKRLNSEFEQNPSDGYLQKQKLLISDAKICTIDSFCIDFIRENFELTGLEPSFKIADKATLNSLYNFALSAVFNEHFDAKDDEFLKLLEAFGEKRDDECLRNCVEKMYEYSQHIPFPENWLDGIVKAYEAHASGDTTKWCSEAIEVAETLAVDAVLELREANALLSTSAMAYEKYAENYDYLLSFAEELIDVCKTGKWNDVYNYLKSIDPPKCKNLSNDDKTDTVKASIKLRDSGKTKLSSAANLVYCLEEDANIEFSKMLPFVKKLIELVKEYGSKISEKLNEKGLITFLTAEQTALSLLAEVKDGEIVRGKYADYFSDLFEAVLVDEYQDTNTLQDTLFYHLSDSGKKLFCVGDMKQCIYKFRGANPTNFLNKKEAAVLPENRNSEDTLRIDLGCNFRSRKEVCEWINSIFKKILYKDNSGFDYDDREKLVSRADYPDNTEKKIESHYVDFESVEIDTEYEGRRYAEAQAVADTIKDIMSRPDFLKNEDGTHLRKTEYKDITILLRSLSDKGVIYANALKENGIPVSLEDTEGLYSDEVNTLISFLKIVNNPSDDIALLTVMTSPIFGITMDELADVRADHSFGSYYSAVMAAYKRKNAKIVSFINRLSGIRRKATMSSIASLIADIFEDTGLLNMVSISERGDLKRLNLLHVQSIALEFEKEGRRSLSDFIKYFESLSNKEFSVNSDSGNAVKIMTIHASKGLQFPICILANCSNQFNETDLNAQYIINEPHGLSFKLHDQNGKAADKNILMTLMHHEERKELLAEELRLFYVALTRAEEMLITFTVYKNLTKEAENKITLLERAEAKGYVPYSVFRRSKSYADWILESHLIDGKKDVFLNGVSDESVFVHKSVLKPKTEETKREKAVADQALVNRLKDEYAYLYPYRDIIGLQAKSSVTDIVHKADSKEYLFTSRPAFMHEKGLTSAERGTAMHKVVQHFDFSATNDIDTELDRLYEYTYISESEYDSVDKELLKSFFSSDLFKRISNAESVKREMRFLTEFPATELDNTLESRFNDENVVVQGAVDLLFVEDGEIVILDFKTDRTKNESELVTAYKQQLEIYAKACSKLLKLPVKELYIYSFALKKEIRL